MENPLVSIVISAENELPYMEECERVLLSFGVPYEIRFLSLQEAPELCIEWAKSIFSRGVKVVIVGSGAVSPLASTISAFTPLPVIAVPLPVSPLQGMDSLLSLAQSNLGAPVATMAVGKVGAANAGLLAVKILAIQYPHLLEIIQSFRQNLQQQVEQKDAALVQDRLQRRNQTPFAQNG